MKTKLLLSSVMMILTFNIFAQGTLEVVVKEIKETKGTIHVGLFDTEREFLKKAVEGKVVKVTGTEVTIRFTNLKAGEYALSVFHDQNENGVLDSNFLGIPKEGFAFGNNAMGMFGPPSFEKAKLKVGEQSAKQEIKLKYM